MGLYKKGTNWAIDFYANGKRYRQVVGPDKKEARIYLGKVQAEIREGRFFEMKKDQKLTFRQLFQRYQEEYSVSRHKPRTQERHLTSSKHLLPVFQDILLKDISPDLIQRYISSRKTTKVANATINRELALLKHSFSIAMKWGWTHENPVKQIEMLREPRGRVRYLSDKERYDLFAVLPWHIRPIVHFAMHTGMRKSEILNLQWSHVFLHNSSVILEDTKNNERRSVPLNDTAKGILEDARKMRSLHIPYVFFNPVTGKAWNDVHHAFQRACKLAGVDNFRFHDLRHTAASYLIMAGVDLTTVKEILGHKTVEMTLRYAHLSPQHKINAAKVLDGALSLVEKKDTLAVGEISINEHPIDTFWSLSSIVKRPDDLQNFISYQNQSKKMAGATGVEPATLGFGDRKRQKQREIPKNTETSLNTTQTLTDIGFKDGNDDKPKE